MQSEECRIMVEIRRNADFFLCIDKCENIDVGNAFMHSEKRTHGMDESIPYDVGLKGWFYCRGDACRWQAFIADGRGQRRQGFHALPLVLHCFRAGTETPPLRCWLKVCNKIKETQSVSTTIFNYPFSIFNLKTAGASPCPTILIS